MANLPRNAKSGNNWTATDLDAYNITVVYQDAETFEKPRHALISDLYRRDVGYGLLDRQ